MSNASPSLVPSSAFDVTVYLVLEDFGKLGRSYLETDEDKADLETVMRNIWPVNIEDRCVLSPSTPARFGHVTFPRMWLG